MRWTCINPWKSLYVCVVCVFYSNESVSLKKLHVILQRFQNYKKELGGSETQAVTFYLRVWFGT